MSRTPPVWPSVTIRRVHKDDWPVLRELRLKALRSDPLAFGSVFEVKLEYPDSRWQELAVQGEGAGDFSTWLAQEAGGRLVGMIVGDYAEASGHLLGLWVDLAVRRRGVAGQLIDRAIAWIHAAHPEAPIQLEVNPRQADAVHLYRARGFRATGKVRGLGYSQGEVLQEMVLSQAPLSPVPPGSRPIRTP